MVRSFADAQLNFEQLARRLGNLAGIDFGTGVGNGGGTVTSTTPVNHNLRAVPTAAFATAGMENLSAAVTAKTDTQLTVKMKETNNSVWSSDQTFYWLAVR